jgi:hypothetical protein
VKLNTSLFSFIHKINPQQERFTEHAMKKGQGEGLTA